MLLLCRSIRSTTTRLAARWFSTGIGGVADGAPPVVFDRALKKLQRDAAALRIDRAKNAMLRQEAAERLVDRLDDTSRRCVQNFAIFRM